MCQVPNMKVLPILHVASLAFPLLFFCASLHRVTSEFSVLLFFHLRDFYASYNHRSTLLYTIFATCSGGPCLVTVSPAAAASVHILFILAYTRSQVVPSPKPRHTRLRSTLPFPLAGRGWTADEIHISEY